MDDSLYDTQPIVIEKTLLNKYFDSYMNAGVKIKSSNESSLLFTYDNYSKGYVNHILSELTSDSTISYALRSSDRTVSISSNLNTEEFYFKIRKSMDNYAYSPNKENSNNELVSSIINLFTVASLEHLQLVVGVSHDITNNKEKYKLATDDPFVSDTFKTIGLSVSSSGTEKVIYTSRFNSDTYRAPSYVFDSIRNRLPINKVLRNEFNRGYAGNLNFIFCLSVDIIAIITGLYFLLH